MCPHVDVAGRIAGSTHQYRVMVHSGLILQLCDTAHASSTSCRVEESEQFDSVPRYRPDASQAGARSLWCRGV